MGARRCRVCDKIAPHGAISCRNCRTPLRAVSRRSTEAGIEAARQHIKEAHQFTSEMGGADRVVKGWLFDLSPQERRPIMEEYGQRHGPKAREYAEDTLPDWMSGRRQMSGMVAKRFFDLLPSHMPLGKKYGLADDLWKHFGPRSEFRLLVGEDATVDEVLSVLRHHLDVKVRHYTIPDELARRFAWLAGDDVAAKLDMLNRMRDGESTMVVNAVAEQFAIMRNKSVSRDGQFMRSWRQELAIGKHQIVIEFDRSISHVVIDDGSASPDRIPAESTPRQIEGGTANKGVIEKVAACWYRLWRGDRRSGHAA